MTSPQPFREHRYRTDDHAEPTALDALLRQYDDAKDAADAAAERLKDVADRIKSELTVRTGPDGAPFDLYRAEGPELRKPLRLKWVVTNRFDTAAFRRLHPETAEQYTTPTGAWRLERERS